VLKRCNSCRLEKDLRQFNKDRSQKDGLDKRCRECAKAHNKRVKERNGDKMRAARNARHRERMATDPEYRERTRRIHRENARKRRSTAQGRAKMREYSREAYARRKADPERWQRFIDQARERLQEIRENDSERYADMLEARRVNRRLRRLENGQAVRNLKRDESKIKVHSAPLKPLIERWVKNREAEVTYEYDEESGASIQPSVVGELADRAGVSTKMIYRIRNPKPGDGDRIELESADAICYALDIPFELVYGQGADDDLDRD
jgi:hypothetical protein